MVALITLALLDLADQFVALTSQHIQVVVGQLAPLLFRLTPELLPIPFNLIPIYDAPPFLLCQPNQREGAKKETASPISTASGGFVVMFLRSRAIGQKNAVTLAAIEKCLKFAAVSCTPTEFLADDEMHAYATAFDRTTSALDEHLVFLRPLMRRGQTASVVRKT